MAEITNKRDRKEYAHNYYLKNKEKILERTNKRYKDKHNEIMEYERKRAKKHSIDNKKRQLKRKKIVFDYYGGKCVCCGESNYAFLSIDHIDNDGKQHRQEIGFSIYPWLIKHNFPTNKRLQILCFNCNLAKQFFGECPHKKELKYV